MARRGMLRVRSRGWSRLFLGLNPSCGLPFGTVDACRLGYGTPMWRLAFSTLKWLMAASSPLDTTWRMGLPGHRRRRWPFRPSTDDSKSTGVSLPVGGFRGRPG